MPNLIKFYLTGQIDEKEYQAVSGMTFDSWSKSKYNVDNLTVSSIGSDYLTIDTYYVSIDDEICYLSEEIKDNTIYSVSSMMPPV